MSAEDLDKLFRDKLQNRPVAPSNDVWERMQARMQPPVVQEEKKPVMWYWSAAAAIVLLITVSIWMLRPGQQINQGSVPMAAKVEKVLPAQPETTPTEVEKEEIKNIENISTPQATGSQALASIQTEGASTETKNRVAPSKKRNVAPGTTQEKMKTQVAPIKLQTPEPEMLAQATPPASNAASTNGASTSSTAAAEPMEIIVKLDNTMAEPTKLAQNTKEPEADKDYNSGRSTGKVMKGIFKQVKNLSQGEKIDLKELGLKHTYALETTIGNKKISKTITL
jgi:cytoskeletal protein RodZ